MKLLTIFLFLGYVLGQDLTNSIELIKSRLIAGGLAPERQIIVHDRAICGSTTFLLYSIAELSQMSDRPNRIYAAAVGERDQSAIEINDQFTLSGGAPDSFYAVNGNINVVSGSGGKCLAHVHAYVEVSGSGSLAQGVDLLVRFDEAKLRVLRTLGATGERAKLRLDKLVCKNISLSYAEMTSGSFALRIINHGWVDRAPETIDAYTFTGEQTALSAQPPVSSVWHVLPRKFDELCSLAETGK